MAEDTRITSPISIRSDARERVALDLMEKIAAYDNTKIKDDTFWFRLYCRAYRATGGAALADVLKD
jgi:hypothetical protein